jgi:hypothetical protein
MWRRLERWVQRMSSQTSGYRAEKVIVNIGLDFGTSSTKTFWRVVSGPGRGAVTVLGSHDPKVGKDAYPSVCVPSTLRIADGKLYFGHKAESVTGGEVFRSLKVCLVSHASGVECRCGRPAHHDGHVRFQDGGAGRVLPVETLCTLLVANLIGRAQRRVRSAFKAGQDVEFLYNMAAPLDQVDRVELLNAFERVLFRGIALAEHLKDGIPLETALDLYRRQSITGLPPDGDRNFRVFSEAAAAIHAYTNSATADEGLYALVDVGAGTTTASFFRLGNRRLDRRVAFYASRTGAVGANDVDLALLAEIGSQGNGSREALLEALRHAKGMVGANGKVSVSGVELTLEGITRVAGPSAVRMFEVVQQAHQRAYEKEQGQSKWERLIVVLVGGGCRIPGVAARLEDRPHQFVERLSRRRLELAPDLRVDGNQSLAADDVELLSVAYGLSFAALDIPEYWHPSEVAPLERLRLPVREIEEEWRY